MRLGTIRRNGSTAAVRLEAGQDAVVLAYGDVGQILRSGELAALKMDSTVERLALDSIDWAPLVTSPNKIVCVGLNYADHIAEMGNATPDYPTYFSKFSGALIGARDDLQLPDPTVSTHNDWEAELAVVIGKPTRNISAGHALDHVAGFTVFNDFSVRDWQRRTKQFLAGKTFENASGLGPVMVTSDAVGDGRGLAISSSVNGVIKQSSNTDELVFGPAEIIADLSQVITLLPGDIIATGTPGGVGAARNPPEWLAPGDELVIEIEGIGELRHRCVGAA